MSQIAYMFAGVGVAVYSSGIFHLLEHAFFKALLFMGAGAVMHAMQDELNIQRMGGLRAKLPFVYWTFLIGVLAIIGTPLFSGFFSKEDIITSAYGRGVSGDAVGWIVWALLVITAGLTALYMFRLLFVVFHGTPRDRELYDHAHGPSLPMRVPMAILALLSIVGGYIAFPGAYNLMESWLHPVFAAFPHGGPVIEPQPFSWVSLILTLLVTAAGVLVAWQVYYRRSPGPERITAAIPSLYNVVYHRYYVDELYDFLFVEPVKWAGRMLYRFFEVDIVDGAVDGSAWLVRRAGSLAGRT
jgi:NADH-quinone oxidoreductase subunit L